MFQTTATELKQNSQNDESGDPSSQQDALPNTAENAQEVIEDEKPVHNFYCCFRAQQSKFQ